MNSQDVIKGGKGGNLQKIIDNEKTPI